MHAANKHCDTNKLVLVRVTLGSAGEAFAVRREASLEAALRRRLAHFVFVSSLQFHMSLDVPYSGMLVDVAHVVYPL